MIIFLNQHMLNLHKEVSFEIEGKKMTYKPESTVKNLALTAMERGDENYVFEASVIITEKDGKWVIDDLN